ncbi:MAG: MarR family winged helix-turn-helix transcriptional regulator [Steroidobacteraceae bacterium]
MAQSTKLAGSRNAKRRGDPAAPGFSLDDSPFFLVNQVAAAYAGVMETSLRAVGMDIPRWRVLMLAQQGGWLPVGEVAKLAGMKLPTATKVVQRLARDGLVKTRTSRTDRRVTEVGLCPRGRRAVATIRSVASGVYQRAFVGFSAEEIGSLTLLLRQLRQALEPPRSRRRTPGD